MGRCTGIRTGGNCLRGRTRARGPVSWGRHEEARAATKRAIQLNPNFARAQTNLSLDRGLAGAAAGEAPRAEPEVAPEGALAHYNLGLAFCQKGYYTEALREYRVTLVAVEQAHRDAFL